MADVTDFTKVVFKILKYPKMKFVVIPFSWIIKHWVGIFHSVLRTIVILVLWYMLPDYKFIAIPFAIVVIYIITMIILKKRKL